MAGNRYGAMESKLIEAWGIFCRNLPNELAFEIERIGVSLVTDGILARDMDLLDKVTTNVDDGEWCYWLSNWREVVVRLWELREGEGEDEGEDEVAELLTSLGHEVEE